jgi:hypothetical protein
MSDMTVIETFFDPDDPAIVVHMTYEFLTAAQLAAVVRAVDGVYESFARLLIYDAFEYVAAPNVIIHGVPLAITRVDTSQSIELEFKLTKKKLPSIYAKEGKLGIALPNWVAVMAVSGAMLVGGLHTYDKVLDVMIKQKDLQLKTIELVEKARVTAKQDNARAAAIQANVHELRAVFLQKNIHHVTVNGVNVKPATQRTPKP